MFLIARAGDRTITILQLQFRSLILKVLIYKRNLQASLNHRANACSCLSHKHRPAFAARKGRFFFQYFIHFGAKIRTIIPIFIQMLAKMKMIISIFYPFLAKMKNFSISYPFFGEKIFFQIDNIDPW
jgi:hypothetical protein